MSVSGKRIPPDRTTYAKGVAAALTRSGHLLEAVVYVQLWWDWANQVSARSYAELGSLVGSSEGLIRQAFRRLEALGCLRRTEVRTGRRRYDVVLVGSDFLGVENLRCDFLGVENQTQAVMWSLPTKMLKSDVSDCYVTLSEFGTDLALTTTTTTTTGVVTAVKNNSVETPEILSVEVAVDVGPAVAAPEAPPVARKSRAKRVKPTKLVKTVESVTSSQEFRTLTMAEIRRDTWWGAIETLHLAWCEGLGKQYALNTWRYAAWRFALVENGYTVEQLQSAIPGVRARDWWRDHCSDPHVMFAKNPSKIEQFFPVNRAVTHDRFGVGAEPTDYGFEF